jgi:hypothetical protein
VWAEPFVSPMSEGGGGGGSNSISVSGGYYRQVSVNGALACYAVRELFC